MAGKVNPEKTRIIAIPHVSMFSAPSSWSDCGAGASGALMVVDGCGVVHARVPPWRGFLRFQPISMGPTGLACWDG